jgi:low temperature requirement protein LtrA
MHPTEPNPHARSHTVAQIGVWLELFYDLVFVAAILVFSSAVSHLHDATRVAWVGVVFAAVWWIWLSTTIFVNRFRRVDLGHRLVLLVQMFLVVLIAMEAREGVVLDASYLTATYGLLVGTVGLMYWQAERAGGPDADFARRLALLHLASVACFMAAAPLPGAARVALAGIGLAVVVAPAIVRAGRLGSYPPLDDRHLIERLGAFTIIVCGESFVKVAIAVSNNTIDGIDVVALAFQLVLTFALWASYFEDIPHAGLNERRIAPWLGLHLVVQLGIAGTAVGVAKLVEVGLLAHLPADDILAIMASLAVVYLGLAGIGACTRRRPIRPLAGLRVGTALAVVVVGLVAWQVLWFDLLEGVAALTVVAVIHAFLVARLRADTVVVPAVDL